MHWVVFLRAVNVGGANRCQPAVIAKQLAKFGVVNVGAVGTFVVRENVSESTLRAAIAKKLPFKCEIMMCRPKAIVDLVRQNPFAGEPSAPNITRFVNVLHKPIPVRSRSTLSETSNVKRRTSELAALPFSLPPEKDWLLKIIAIENRFVLGLYRREMKAISYLGKVEKLLGVPATTRNWNTIEKVVKILQREP